MTMIFVMIVPENSPGSIKGHRTKMAFYGGKKNTAQSKLTTASIRSYICFMDNSETILGKPQKPSPLPPPTVELPTSELFEPLRLLCYIIIVMYQ